MPEREGKESSVSSASAVEWKAVDWLRLEGSPEG
jgi:hypothetical protein